jgi:hypothetical protein
MKKLKDWWNGLAWFYQVPVAVLSVPVLFVAVVLGSLPLLCWVMLDAVINPPDEFP